MRGASYRTDVADVLAQAKISLGSTNVLVSPAWVPNYAWLSTGYLYAIEFSSGAVKVGRAGNPFARLKTYGFHAVVGGYRIDRIWVSDRFDHPHAAERVLITFADQQGARNVGNEYFFGLSFDAIVRRGRQLVYDEAAPRPPITEAEADAERVIDALNLARRRLAAANAAAPDNVRADKLVAWLMEGIDDASHADRLKMLAVAQAINGADDPSVPKPVEPQPIGRARRGKAAAQQLSLAPTKEDTS